MSANEVETAVWLRLSWLSFGELSLEGHWEVRSISGVSLTDNGLELFFLVGSIGQFKKKIGGGYLYFL